MELTSLFLYRGVALYFIDKVCIRLENLSYSRGSYGGQLRTF
jgi:hypothetical protein